MTDDLEPGEEPAEGEPAPDEPVAGADELPEVRDGDAGEGDLEEED